MGSALITNTNTNYTNYYNFSVCITPNFSNVSSDYSITYSATNYNPRSYSITSATLNNVTQSKTLYLLLTADSKVFFFVQLSPFYLLTASLMMQ
jgi:hypothetical protein